MSTREWIDDLALNGCLTLPPRRGPGGQQEQNHLVDLCRLARLGLCVVESGVQPEDFRVHVPTTPGELEQEWRVGSMCQALAAEMERGS
jgi:hypothetical protein